jgi:hypothetical protein
MIGILCFRMQESRHKPAGLALMQVNWRRFPSETPENPLHGWRLITLSQFSLRRESAATLVKWGKIH